jgi:hypothetical protein
MVRLIRYLFVLFFFLFGDVIRILIDCFGEIDIMSSPCAPMNTFVYVILFGLAYGFSYYDVTLE